MKTSRRRETMRRKIIPLYLALTTFFANCDVTRPIANENALLDRKNPAPPNARVFETPHHRKNRKARCRRDLPYRAVPSYQRNYAGQMVYVGGEYPPYRTPPEYVPAKCYNYCPYCPVPSCRRRCPPASFQPIARPSSSRWSTRRTTEIVACTCDIDGAKFPMCDDKTGACVCNPHYKGHHCDTCEDGFWKNNRKCDECKCNKYGTEENTHCDKQTGKCHCKPGVTGTRCEACMPGHYGTIATGCKKCDPCNKKGHKCDPTNGKCVCPPLTEGKACESCSANSYGYEPDLGCKACDCSKSGSENTQCDGINGRCTCKIGYEGEKCNRCSYGYYGYPNCLKCSCHPEGTLEEECEKGLCQCDVQGYCKCKENVQGKNCDSCKKNKYGLTKENPKGCTDCFCFGRSDQCDDAHYHWSKTTRLEKNNGDDSQVAQDELMLPRQFLGDLTSSYGGYLAVQVPGDVFNITLEGNGVKLRSLNDKNELQMVETSNWRVSSRNPNFPNDCIDNLTRACFMIVLEKVTSIAVQAKNRIREVLLDKANEDVSYAITHSIEQCECPQEYSGLSCQNPNKGYFRYFPKDPDTSWIDRVVGVAKPCQCGGHSKECDPESGNCKNCTDHTTGDHCENCDVGFYMNKTKNCAACLCPSADQNNAKSCSPTGDGFECECKIGYRGKYCDECEANYYMAPGSKTCQPCGCNRYGTRNSGSCDHYGKCYCIDGFKGNKCDQCVKERQFIENGICKTCDECTMKLFDEIDKMKNDIEGILDSFKNGIGPPWEKLTDDIDKLDGLSEKFFNKKEAIEDLLEASNIDLFEKKVSEMEKQLIKNNKLAEDNGARTETIYKNSTMLLEETEELNNKLMRLISTLNNFGTKQVNLKEALKRAKHELKEIQTESTRLKQLDKNVFAQCEAINKKVESIYKPPPTLPDGKLKELKTKLQDLINIVSSVDNSAKLADLKNTENSARIEKVKEKIEKLKSKNKNLQTSMGEIFNKTEAIEEIMQQLIVVLEDLKEISDFDEFDELENRVKRQMDDIPQIEDLYSRAIEHVQELENKINHYHNLFNFTKDEWKKINASGAYEAIIHGVEQARLSVKESEKIFKQAVEIINPDGTDNLDARTNLAHAYSDRLKQRINNLKNISNKLNDTKNKLDDLKYNILENGKSNNDLTQILHKIDKDITSQSHRAAELEEAKRKALQVSEDMRQIDRQLGGILLNNQTYFSKNYKQYNEEAAEITDFVNKLATTGEELKDLNFSTPSYNSDKAQHDRNLKNLEKKIKQLQANITEAKQQVDVIDVAMDLTNCTATYKRSKPEYFESLSITYSCQNCVLFTWRKSNSPYLTLSVKNDTPILRVGKKQEQLNDDFDRVRKRQRERTIVLRKEGSHFTLQQDDEKVSMKTEDRTVQIQTQDTLVVGSTEKLAEDAYVYKIFLNGKNFGLWRFNSTNGMCKGRGRDARTIGDNRNSFFNGEGFQKYNASSLNPKQLSFQFTFQTFDENGTIFVAEHIHSCSFIYLYLLGGRVHFTMRHAEGHNDTVLISDIKVNDARPHTSEIGLQFQAETQTYNLKVDNDIKSASVRMSRRYVFKIKASNLYVGGVPPSFDKNCIPVTTDSFLGFLKRNQPFTEKISYGVIRTSKSILEFSHAWINENGYIDIATPETLLKNLSFVLRPQSDGIIMKFQDDLNISLKNWKIVINGIDSGIGLEIDNYYNIQLRLGNDQELIINDLQPISLSDMKEVSVKNIQLGDQYDGFSGGIRDIMINDNMFTFNATSVKDFSGVEIGREKPIDKAELTYRSLTMMNLTNSMQNTEGCVDFDSYNPEVDAVKYGDKPNSYTLMKTNFWKSNSTLQFDFRTLYPDGTLFISSNKKMKYILLELREGHLYLTIKRGKKKAKPLQISTHQKVNDGKWHNLSINRKLKKLSVILDREKQPKKVNFRLKPKDEIHFGGVPSDSAYMMFGDLFDKLHTFRGCLRNLTINNEQKLSMKNSKEIQHHGITQCFSNVEEGAYFGGDAFAVYRDDFRVEPVKLSFEFRTSEQNGVILSVSNEGDAPALSVELQNGAIVMTVDNGKVSNVTNNLDSDFSLCNNRWHNVTALYSSSELTVNVDGITKSWVVSDINSMMNDLEAPLYVGGLPDGTHQKHLTNFKGCLRKLMIETKLVGWSDMKELSNVLLNSCPVKSRL